MESTTRLRVVVLLILIGVALASSLWAVWPWPTGDWKALALNFGTEMAGAVVTYALLELFIGRRERREAEEKELEAKKVNLIAQMGSSVKDVAVAAAEELRRHGWLYDGSLQGADLAGADLQGAALSGANLQEAILSGANLQEAYLIKTNLQGTTLYWTKLQKAALPGANLQGANLGWAKLQGADMHETNLQGADLSGANSQGTILFLANLQRADLFEANLQEAVLSGANLQGADLAGANLQEANFNKSTTLPDGTHWTPDTDMARFTDPDHPDFWRPDA